MKMQAVKINNDINNNPQNEVRLMSFCLGWYMKLSSVPINQLDTKHLLIDDNNNI